MSADHLITHRIGALCRMPPDHPVGDDAHIVGNQFWCAAHCPVCNKKPEPPKKPRPQKSESLF